MELYAGEGMMLVQTTVYGQYPQARGDIGFAVEAGEGVEVLVSDLKAWSLNL